MVDPSLTIKSLKMKKLLLFLATVLFITALRFGLSGVQDISLPNIIIGITSLILGLVFFLFYFSTQEKEKHKRDKKVIANGYSKVHKNIYRIS